jgi:hypothetical protein
MPILASPPNPDKPKLLDQVRDLMRRKYYSIRTKQSYIEWIRRFILFHKKRRPLQMAEEKVTVFLTHLARAAKTQSLPQLIANVRSIFRNEIDKMMTLYEKSNADFYNGPFAARVIVNRAALHGAPKPATPAPPKP